MSKFNQWFLGLPEGRKEVLRADKWLMADAAFNAREKELSDLSTRFTALMQQNNTLAAENERLSEKLAAMESQEPQPYDAGFLNDFGGGNVGWWHDYIRAELDRAHDHYTQQFTVPADKPEVEQRCAECGPVDAGTALYCVKCWDGAHKPAVAVPDGYRLLPFPPTKEMCEAAPSMPAIELPKDFKLTKSGWKPNEIQNLKRFIAMANAAPSHSQQSARPTDDELWDQTITERDTYHDWADKLANAISEYFGSDIGEHTSANNPWAEALEVIERDDSLEDWRNMLERAANFLRTSGIVAVQGSLHPACSWLYEAELLLADRCPSHESEQGYNPKTFGAIPDQQTEGE